MNDGQPPSVGKLAMDLGFLVEFADLPNGVSGYLEQEPFAEKGWKIVVNANHPVTRQRWTALHEIAHYYLHPRYTETVGFRANRAQLGGLDHFYESDDELQEEREANEWVDAIVFEQNALRAARSLHGNDLKAIARIFGVSIETLKIALRRLE
jgi:Zn-dependent peptidase ImmA (M78 family)